MGTDKEEWHIKRLLREFKERGHESYLLPITRFKARIGTTPKISVRGYPIDDYDALIVRRVPGGTAEQVFYRMDTLHRLEEMGVMVFNPSKSIEKAVDKYYTSAILEEEGIKTPRTIVTESFSESMRGYKELGEDIVVKPLFGSLGMGVTRVSNEDIAYRIFRALEMTKSVYYLQEFIPNMGFDVRCFVIDGEVVGREIRSNPDDFRYNVAVGGRAEPFEDDIYDELALKVADAVGLKITGLDILPRNDGEPIVIEANCYPGYKALMETTGIPIYQLIVDYFERILRL